MNIIKKLLLNVFGDGFFGLERDDTTQMDISKDNRKKTIYPTTVCYASPPKGWDVPSSSCMGVCAGGIPPSFSSGQHNVGIGVSGMHSCNDQFIETHNE